MIVAEGIHVVYGGPPAAADPPAPLALDGIDLTLRSAEAVALVGGNGCGKTTLLRVLAGLIPAWRGRVRLDDRDLATETGRLAARSSIALLFSNPEASLIAPSVEREIAFGLENRAWSKAEMDERVAELLDRFDLRRRRADSPLALSGGERARLALAAALAWRPRFLFVDESLSYLDAEHRAQARSALERAREAEGVTLLWATHDFADVERAERILVLAKGRLIEDLPRARLLDEIDALERAGLTASPLALLHRDLARAGLDAGPSLTPGEMAESLDRARQRAEPHRS